MCHSSKMFIVVAKEALFLLVMLTAYDTLGGRACSVDGDLIIVCNNNNCARVMTGGAVGINEVVSKVK